MQIVAGGLANHMTLAVFTQIFPETSERRSSYVYRRSTSGIWGGPRVMEEGHAAAWAVAENLAVDISPGKSATEDQASCRS